MDLKSLAYSMIPSTNCTSAQERLARLSSIGKTHFQSLDMFLPLAWNQSAAK